VQEALNTAVFWRETLEGGLRNVSRISCADELTDKCITWHDHNTRWEDNIEGRLFSLGERTLGQNWRSLLPRRLREDWEGVGERTPSKYCQNTADVSTEKSLVRFSCFNA